MDQQAQKIRSLLYEKFALHPLYNPVGIGEESNIIDLTFDVSNYTRLYHNETEAVRGLLSKADMVVTDTPQLASVISQFGKKVVAIPFAHTIARDIHGEFTVGVLNHDDDTDMANIWAQNILRRIDRNILVYGAELNVKGIEQEVTENFKDFAGRTDILLLPGIPQSITSITLPLSVMMSGAAVLASNGGSWAFLNSAAGVVIMSPDRKDFRLWKRFIDGLEKEPRKLITMKERNLLYVQRVNMTANRMMQNVASRLQAPEKLAA